MRGSTAGMSEGMIGPSKNIHTMFLTFVDVIFSSLVLAPLIVLYWRGTWNCMDRLLIEPLDRYNGYVSLAIGVGGHLLCTVSQKPLARAFHPDRHRIAYFLASRGYTYAYGIVCVNGWRGGWQLLSHLPQNIDVTAPVTLVAVASLVLLKGLRNISAAPFAVATDHSKDYFVFPTMFKKATDEPGLYILDCLFSVVVIGSLVVFVWRGVWLLCDLLIYPENFTRSSWASLFIGYGIVGASFCMQSTMRWLCEQLSGGPRLAAADIFLAFSFVGTVNVWRGVWNMCDLYFIPDDHKLAGDVITHAVPFLLLALLNCSNSVLVRGVYIDAEEPAGQCVVFPVYYVRLFFQKERTKKQKRAQQQLQQQHSGKTATTTLLPLLGSGNGGEDVEGCAGEALKANQKPTIVIVPTNHISAATNDDSGNNNDE